MAVDDIYEAAELWPVRLVLPGLDRLTLWGAGGDYEGLDRLPVVDGRLVLFASEDQLRDFVESDERSSLIDLPRYTDLRDALRTSAALADPYVNDYLAVLSLLAQPPGEWSIEDCGLLVNTLNMLRDIADNVGDLEIRGRVDRPDGYQALVDVLMLVEPGEVEASVGDIDTRELGEWLRGDLERVVARSRTLS